MFPCSQCVKCHCDIASGDAKTGIDAGQLPHDCGTAPFYSCSKCVSPNNCPWCGLAFQFGDKKTILNQTDILWRSCSPAKFLNKDGKGRRGKKPRRGFVPCGSDHIHKKCLNQLGKQCPANKKNEKHKLNATRTETENTSVSTPATKKQRIIEVNLDKEGPLDADEMSLQHNLNNRSEKKGQFTQKFGKTYIHVPNRTGVSPSTEQRQRTTMLAAVNSQVAPGQTQSDALRNLSRSRACVAAGVTRQEVVRTAEDDLDNWVDKLRLTLYQVRTFVSVLWKRHGIRLGQTVNNHRKKKKERKVSTLYSTEHTEQADGTTKKFHYKRVTSVAGLVAGSIGTLKRTGAFVDHDVGNKTTNKIPFGSALVSPVVCWVLFCVRVCNCKNKNKNTFLSLIYIIFLLLHFAISVLFV